ncbi:MAG: aminoglycoside phosphotransferase family protein [Bacteroidota bacterium]
MWYSKEGLEKIAIQFIDNQSIESIQPLGNGHIHQTYLVDIYGDNAFVLQRINTQVFRDPNGIVSNMKYIAAHLEQQPSYAMKLLHPLATKDGQYLHVDTQNHHWRATPFLDNTTSYSKIETPEQAAAAAKAFGQFAYALRDFPVEQLAITLPGFHDSASRYEYYQHIKPKASLERLQQAQSVIQFVEEEASLFQQVIDLNLPLRVVHNDTKADNVLLDAVIYSGVCVIDLDTVMPGTILSDFGDMVRTFTNSHAEDHAPAKDIEARYDVFEALSHAYLKEIHPMLTETEKTHLLDGALWIILEQVLRFLTDFLANDVYYPIHYPMHNLVRAENQMALWQSIWRQRERWENYLKSIT